MFGLTKGDKYPILPLRDIVVFPHMIVPLFVGREKSVKALEDVMRNNTKNILLVTQTNPALDDPTAQDLYTVGTLGTILQLLKLPDGTIKVLVEGTQRVRIIKFGEESEHLEAYAEVIPESKTPEDELEVLVRTTITQFEQYLKLNRKIPPDVLITINQIDDPAKLADTIASYLSLKIPDKQLILEITGVGKRLEKSAVFY